MMLQDPHNTDDITIDDIFPKMCVGGMQQFCCLYHTKSDCAPLVNDDKYRANVTDDAQ